MFKSHFKLGVIVSSAMLLALTFSGKADAYTRITLYNTTSDTLSFKLKYSGCSEDYLLNVHGHSSATAKAYRGSCLMTSINVWDGSKAEYKEIYASSGTGYATFNVLWSGSKYYAQHCGLEDWMHYPKRCAV